MSSNMRTKWAGGSVWVDSEHPDTEYRAYNGKVYEGKMFMNHTNVLAMQVAPEGETAPSEGISFPWAEWKRLPLSNAPEIDPLSNTHP